MRTWPPVGKGRVVVFLDQSGSMAGFLDPSFPTQVRTDFRFVLDGVLSNLGPSKAYLFGTKISQVAPTMGVLGDSRLYSDSNTNMELALDSIAADKTFRTSYLIIGDGRRGDPNVANGQYSRIRDLADRWIDHGGTFMVAASKASFERKKTDPSGCTVASRSGQRSTCPLYTFAFVSADAEAQIASALGDVFQHLFAWPMKGVLSGDFDLTYKGPAPDLTIEHRWKPMANGERILRVRTRGAPNRVLATRLVMSDSVSSVGRARVAALRGQEIEQRIWVKPLTAAAANQPWQLVTRPGAQVRTIKGVSGGIELISNRSDGPRAIYRVDLVPTGRPQWLEEFDAPQLNDPTRTFGLGSLFRIFDRRREGALPTGHFYIVAN